jgi:hypothetical protein
LPENALLFALPFSFFRGLPFVMLLLALGKTDINFDPSPAVVHVKRIKVYPARSTLPISLLISLAWSSSLRVRVGSGITWVDAVGNGLI